MSGKRFAAAPSASCGPVPPPPSAPWQVAQLAAYTWAPGVVVVPSDPGVRLVGEEQHDRHRRRDQCQHLDDVHDPTEHQNTGSPAGVR